MSIVQTVDPKDFVSRVQPALKKQDWSELLGILQANWTPDQILGLLECDHCDARKVAALAIGLVGKSCCLPALSKRLADKDPMVGEMAEHAMWQIWFRSGGTEANKHLARGAEALNLHDLDNALTHLNTAITLEPQFAEAYNQRAIAHYIAERYDESIADCKRVLELIPEHFGAWAGLGHCYAATGKVTSAVQAYERALEINPRLECIAELVHELHDKIDHAPHEE